MPNYTTIAENPNSTVVAEYSPEPRNAKHHQSEHELEQEFISQLVVNGYHHLPIKHDNDLLCNLRVQLEKLNAMQFSDAEWQRLRDSYLAKKNEGIKEKTAKVQEDSTFAFKRDDGLTKNVRILDKQDIHNNSVQVINQYETTGARKNRYDVTILVNGLPMVHVELKRRGVAIREAFNQIDRYQRDSMWAGSGLFEYVQLFVISNGVDTKYYSNTTRDAHVKEWKGNKSRNKTSNSFAFTCWWTDATNKRISDLVDFSKTFFSKHALLSILIKYCVLTAEQLLLVMRPYQIAAAERIMNRIAMATNHDKLGTIDAGGYIWHTTGSGKTLTSFKTAQLASKLEAMAKVLFVVDRKDLDYQTMKEYDRFEKGAANSNTNTATLTKQLADTNVKIIITTIQKLSRFIAANKKHSIVDKHVVLIFDECHRSQFGTMHTAITAAFTKYHIFGFTGTPIFAANASSSGGQHLKTTEQVFGQKLHAYTIVDAINDQNVLPFRVDYTNTLKMKEDVEDKKVRAIDVEAVANAPQRIKQVTDYILEHFDKKTKGFNSIFAVSSIEAAKKYYDEFKSRDSGRRIATIYSFGANEAAHEDGILPDEDFDTAQLDLSSRDFLDRAIKDYNRCFATNYDTSAERFENYYKDISQRMKNRDIDLLIVVNMFLTGFDATTLNTLWVDKNLRYHGLLQAFSRTNRILNSAKVFGNIVCFRDLEKATNDALSIFGNKDAVGIVLLKSFDEYYRGWDEDGERHQGYTDIIEELQQSFPLPLSIKGEQAEKDFINLWGSILRLRNILTSFDEFADKELLSERNFQDYQSGYLDLYDKIRKHAQPDKEKVNDDIEFEIELVKQITINIDYILELVVQYIESNNKDVRINITKKIDSSIELRSKKELIEQFIATLNARSVVNQKLGTFISRQRNTEEEKASVVTQEWRQFIATSQDAEFDKIIEEEKLNPEKAKKFIANAFKRGHLEAAGTEFADIVPPTSMFSQDNALDKKRAAIFARLTAFFDKYSGV